MCKIKDLIQACLNFRTWIVEDILCFSVFIYSVLFDMYNKWCGQHNAEQEKDHGVEPADSQQEKTDHAENESSDGSLSDSDAENTTGKLAVSQVLHLFV